MSLRSGWRKRRQELSSFVACGSALVYHLVREWHGLPELPYLGQELPYIRDDPNLGYV